MRVQGDEYDGALEGDTPSMNVGHGAGPGKAYDGDLLETPTRQYTPRISGWYPSSFHCEQGQNVGLIDSVPLGLEVDIK